MLPWAVWPQNWAVQGNIGQLLHFDPLLFLLPAPRASIHYSAVLSLSLDHVGWHAASYCVSFCSWTVCSDAQPLIVFISLFWPVQPHTQDLMFMSHLFTLLLCCSHAWTLCGPLNTLYLLCTFPRTKISCTCPITTYTFCSPLGLKQLECPRASPTPGTSS